MEKSDPPEDDASERGTGWNCPGCVAAEVCGWTRTSNRLGEVGRFADSNGPNDDELEALEMRICPKGSQASTGEVSNCGEEPELKKLFGSSNGGLEDENVWLILSALGQNSSEKDFAFWGEDDVSGEFPASFCHSRESKMCEDCKSDS